MIIPAQPGWFLVSVDEDRDTADESAAAVIAWKETETADGGTHLSPVVENGEAAPFTMPVGKYGGIEDYLVVFRDPIAGTALAITLHKAARAKPMSREELTEALLPLHRRLFEAALHEAVMRRWITRQGDKFTAGPERAPASWNADD
ncbi:hypothetical protein ABZ357_21395 [Streptomyces sp. NPDC005917]|uniref:hypothetical protein n=1 Tax=unclassified Streptomyces TaxID=2593676 RepID=UPI003401308E